MDEARKNRDFSKGPVWDPETNRWLVEIRYPDGSRLRKRFRREREALRLWSAEQNEDRERHLGRAGAEDGHARARRSKQYRDYSKVQNRSHETYVEPALSRVGSSIWAADTLLAQDHDRRKSKT